MRRFILLHIYAVEKGKTKLQIVRNSRKIVDYETALISAASAEENLWRGLGTFRDEEPAYQTKKKGRLLDSLSKYVILRLPDNHDHLSKSLRLFGIGPRTRGSRIMPRQEAYKGKTLYILLCPYKAGSEGKRTRSTYWIGGFFRYRHTAMAAKQPGDKLAFAFTSLIAPELFVGVEPESEENVLADLEANNSL